MTIGLGPDQEPLIVEFQPLAALSDDVLDQARRHYQERFAGGKDSRG